MKGYSQYAVNFLPKQYMASLSLQTKYGVQWTTQYRYMQRSAAGFDAGSGYSMLDMRLVYGIKRKIKMPMMTYLPDEEIPPIRQKYQYSFWVNAQNVLNTQYKEIASVPLMPRWITFGVTSRRTNHLKINTMKTHQLIGLGCLMMATSIALGAMGAHTLEDAISARYLDVWKTASLYFALNGLGFMSISGSAPSTKGMYLKITILGAFIFSVSLWFLALNELISPALRKLGAVTPIGGVLMIIGWTLIGIHQLRR
jgi:uncharacterized membrane protein YgdD (TMEM256/DUF423 family)